MRYDKGCASNAISAQIFKTLAVIVGQPLNKTDKPIKNKIKICKMGLFDKLFGGTKNTEPPEITNFTTSDKLMDEEVFWKIIETTKDKSKGDYEQQQDELANELRKLNPDEIILFGNRFRFFRGQANTWELWGAIYIIHGGCSDDSFNDFREWVIGQGKDFYNKTIQNPEGLVEVETGKIEDVEWEGLGYVPSTVFEELTGQEMPYPFQENHNTTGKEWSEEGDDLQKIFPKLYAKYCDSI
ncbi:DUF4240 domain-containing protein [Pedobacter sandarakinus]|uniref:DUF4240 domain-containing protein n=1 Tax=Pedobacter sandarakinus TaxID=353156 RepID=UPI00224621B1|nr:DUF4240 domain-containing protein [Pedobacter sandarakinus]MCX2575370.1 DUF4240 domain-containing protein [Pedobacter sandarakinus]